MTETGLSGSLLRASSISKSYAGVRALEGVSFDLRAGEVHALVGENGAGKSTLIKIITGAVEADAGQLELDGKPITSNNPIASRALGIAAIYQQPSIFPDLTIAENIALGLEHGRLLRRLDWRARSQTARSLLNRIGADIDPERLAGTLSMPEQQMLEIARSLGASARVLILDEPTASLTEREVEALFKVIRELRAQGVGIIYISHRLEELFAIADRVTVLCDGHTVTTREMSAIDERELIHLMVGRELSEVFPKREVPLGETLLETRGLSCRATGIHDVSVTVRAGEILGLSGLVGAGRTEFAKALFGLSPADGGAILLRGNPVAINSPSEAIARGIAYLPEDRRRHGVILDMSVAANTTLASLRRVARHGLIDFEAERKLAGDYTHRLGVKTHSLFATTGNLSGGNQQKVAVGRWLATEPLILILDEPTQGIDVGAKAEIHGLMCDLAERGMAIIMISSELPEILGMSDRIAVMRHGTIAATLERAEASQHILLELALG
ncbi:MAG: sugar ABC transporter ATP-binding protein [Acidobacteriota bacterium]